MTANDAPIDAILRAVVAERDVAVRERDEAREQRDALIDRQGSIVLLMRERDEARAERDRFKAAVERAVDICEDAATMGCDCDGYYRCGSCPSAIASRADDAVEVLLAALAVPAPPTDEDKRTPR